MLPRRKMPRKKKRFLLLIKGKKEPQKDSQLEKNRPFNENPKHNY